MVQSGSTLPSSTFVIAGRFFSPNARRTNFLALIIDAIPIVNAVLGIFSSFSKYWLFTPSVESVNSATCVTESLDVPGSLNAI